MNIKYCKLLTDVEYFEKYDLFIFSEPGTFEFTKPSFLFKESAGKAIIPIQRVNGADGKVEILVKTEDMTAKTGKDYEGGEQKVVFDHGEIMMNVEITLFDDQVRQ